MADATLYTSMDIGGPGADIRPVGSSPAHSWFNVLVPCLVSGYGPVGSRKEGQGWELIHERLPDGFTLKAPDGVFYIWSSQSSTNPKDASMCEIWMAEGLSAPYTYPPVGDNVRSGSHSPTYYPRTERCYIGALGYPSTALTWYVMARGSKVLVHTCHREITNRNGFRSTGTVLNSSNYSYGQTSFLGNVILRDPLAPKEGSQNSVVLGATVFTAPLSGSSQYYSVSNGLRSTSKGETTRLRSWLTGAIELESLPVIDATPAKYRGTADPFKNIMPPSPPDFTLERVDVTEEGLSIAYMPGVFFARYFELIHYPSFSLALGRGQTYQDSLVPLEVEGEDFYVFPSFHGCAVFSLLEKYWV